jgi:hypothetical protein
MEEEKPACLAEVELVKKMAEHTWCSERASRLQEGCFLITRTDEQRKNLQGEVVIHPQLERFLRYQAHHDRAYQRASDELLKRRKERLKAERGFVCGTCKIRTIGSGQVSLGQFFREADKALGCEAAA